MSTLPHTLSELEGDIRECADHEEWCGDNADDLEAAGKADEAAEWRAAGLKAHTDAEALRAQRDALLASVKAGTVVRFAERGARRRYIVLTVHRYGGIDCPAFYKLHVLALSGGLKGCGSSDTFPEQVTPDVDQTVGFSGAIAHVLRARYRELVEFYRVAARKDATIVDVAPALPSPGGAANDAAA
jgi:hypothetical protein